MKHLKFLTVLVAMSACSAEKTDDLNEPNSKYLPVKIAVEPGDLSTGIRGSDLNVRLWRVADEIPDNVITAAKESIQVVTEDGTPIPFTATIQPPPAVGAYHYERRDIQIQLQAWPDEWFEIRVHSISVENDPYHSSIGDEDSVEEIGVNQYRARLNPGSAPIGRFVQVCGSGDAPLRAHAQFSQNVVLQADRPVLTFRGEACARNMADAPVMEDGSPSSSSVVTFDCPAGALEGDVRLDLNGVSSPDGVVATLPDGPVFSSTTAEGRMTDEGCVRWDF